MQKNVLQKGQHIWVLRWRVFNFAQALFQCMPSNWITVVSKLNFIQRNVFAKSMIFEKNSVHLDSNPWPLECKLAALPIELFVLWFSMECCLSFFHFFVFNLLWNATTLTHGDKLGWWVYGIRQLNCWCRQSQVSYRHGRWIDGQTDGQVCIYSLLLPFNDLLLWVWKDNIYACMHLVHPYVYTYTYIHTHT